MPLTTLSKFMPLSIFPSPSSKTFHLQHFEKQIKTALKFPLHWNTGCIILSQNHRCHYNHSSIFLIILTYKGDIHNENLLLDSYYILMWLSTNTATPYFKLSIYKLLQTEIYKLWSLQKRNCNSFLNPSGT